MLMQALSFSCLLLPVNRRLAHRDVASPNPIRWTCLIPKTKYNLELKKGREPCLSRPRPASILCQLPPLTAIIAALAVLISKPGRAVASLETSRPAQLPTTSSSQSLSQHDDRHHGPSEAPQGTLLRVHPGITQDAHTDSSGILRSKGSPRSGTTRSTAGLQGSARTRLQRTMRASRSVRIARVRPTTLGLVGVGAFTSGSVFLRSINRGTSRKRDEPFLSTQDVCSVVSLQIPFCVSERAQMLQSLDELAKHSSLNDAEGMAKASRTAAAILLEEEGLFEDSTKFAPYIDVFLAENLESAEKRFSGHVATEESRQRNIDESQAERKSEQGLYGVVTMVVATMEGVDLACYDEHSTLVSRLRHALHSISKLHGGEVAGLELIWVPENARTGPLTRTQISDAYPWLRVG